MADKEAYYGNEVTVFFDDVAITYVASDAKAAAVVADLEAKGVRALAIKCDQENQTQAEPLIRKWLGISARSTFL